MTTSINIITAELQARADAIRLDDNIFATERDRRDFHSNLETATRAIEAADKFIGNLKPVPVTAEPMAVSSFPPVTLRTLKASDFPQDKRGGWHTRSVTILLHGRTGTANVRLRGQGFVGQATFGPVDVHVGPFSGNGREQRCQEALLQAIRDIHPAAMKAAEDEQKARYEEHMRQRIRRQERREAVKPLTEAYEAAEASGDDAALNKAMNDLDAFNEEWDAKEVADAQRISAAPATQAARSTDF